MFAQSERVVSLAVAAVVPANLPFTLLLSLIATALAVSLIVYALPRDRAPSALALCARCSRLHDRTETVARSADAVAVGALAFLIALPFVAAGYESGFTLPSMLLGVSAVVAVLAVAAEANFLAREAAARRWPHQSWRAGPGRILGGGARWLGTAIALYLLFDPHYVGVAGRFGTVGQRLVVDLGSPWTIFAAAEILLLAALVALSARWLVPIAFGSRPSTIPLYRDPHGKPA